MVGILRDAKNARKNIDNQKKARNLTEKLVINTKTSSAVTMMKP